MMKLLAGKSVDVLSRHEWFQLCAAFWFMCALFTAGVWNADMRWDDPKRHHTVAQCRNELSIGILMGLIGGPVALPVDSMMLLLDGQGWTFSIDPMPIP